ncbi:MAG: putative toxin-antitoxin system toxin component, PIN family [Ginsengibacter sp.]
MPRKIIIDTNVWISYFINARADYLVNWIIENDITVFTSGKLVTEIKDVLSRPKFKKQFPYPVSDFVNLHLQVCILIKISEKFTNAPDPDDNFLFDLALKANAEFLITSDKLLLSYATEFDLEIITFPKFRELGINKKSN